MQLEFTSTKIKADIEGLKKFLKLPDDFNIIDSRAEVIVEFTAQIIRASWGISSIFCVVNSVKGAIEYEYEGYEDKDVTDFTDSEGGYAKVREAKTFQKFGEININYSIQNALEWKIQDEIKPCTEGEFLSVTQVSINLETKEIFVA